MRKDKTVYLEIWKRRDRAKQGSWCSGLRAWSKMQAPPHGNKPTKAWNDIYQRLQQDSQAAREFDVFDPHAHLRDPVQDMVKDKKYCIAL